MSFRRAVADTISVRLGSSAWTTGSWQHVGGSVAFGSFPSLYKNGVLNNGLTSGPATTAGTYVDAVSASHDSIGSELTGSAPASTVRQFDGKIAHLAIFNRELTAAEFAALARGNDPRTVSGCVAYFPLWGLASPEPDLVNGRSGTITGSVPQAVDPLNVFTGATDSNWGTAGNWLNAAVPTATDGYIATFNATSPNCSVNSSNRACNALNFTGYTNTITMTFAITVSGAITFSSGMGISGTGAFGAVSATSTLTSNGKTIPVLTIGGTSTYTLADNFTVIDLNAGTLTSTTTINGNQITILGNFNGGGRSTGSVAGTTNFIMAGTGSIIFPTTTGKLCTNNFTIASTAVVTFPSGTLRYDTGTFTVETGATLTVPADLDVLCASNVTWDTKGSLLTFRDFTSSNGTHTFLSPFHCRDFINTSASNIAFTGSEIHISRNMTFATTTGTVTQSTVFVFTGTGTITTAGMTTGRFTGSFKIDSPGGTITFVSSITTIDMGKFNLVSGTVVTPYGTFSTGPESRGGVFDGGIFAAAEVQ